MITTIINYCSLDKRFIWPQVEQAKCFSNEIIIVFFDHLLNGKSDFYKVIESLKGISGIKLLPLPFNPEMSGRFHHNFSRWCGAGLATCEWILFLDGDEIINGSGMQNSINNLSPFEFDAVTFECFWYFREPTNQAVITENAGLLVRKSKIDVNVNFTERERWAYLESPNISTIPSISGLEGPIMHHYSWVRNRQGMIDKVTSWGHKGEKDWVALVEAEFNKPLGDTDFVHGYQYRKVSNFFKV
jgi:hypothetical protein